MKITDYAAFIDGRLLCCGSLTRWHSRSCQRYTQAARYRARCLQARLLTSAPEPKWERIPKGLDWPKDAA